MKLETTSKLEPRHSRANYGAVHLILRMLPALLPFMRSTAMIFPPKILQRRTYLRYMANPYYKSYMVVYVYLHPLPVTIRLGVLRL